MSTEPTAQTKPGVLGRLILWGLAVFSKLDLTPAVVAVNAKDQLVWRRVGAAVIDCVLLFSLLSLANSIKIGQDNFSIRLSPGEFWIDAISVITPLVTLKPIAEAIRQTSALGIPMERLNLLIFSPFFAMLTIWLYHSVLESTAWQGSLGKKICGVAVTDLNGQRVSFIRAAKRNAAKSITFLPYLFSKWAFAYTSWNLPEPIYQLELLIGISGPAAAIASLNKQCLHDAIADTLVQRDFSKQPAKKVLSIGAPVTENTGAPASASAIDARKSTPIAAVSPGPVRAEIVEEVDRDEMKECPACAEWIKKKAKKCRYCQERFE